MELVDILARELKKWPFTERRLGQASDGSLHTEPFIGGHTVERYSVAEDYLSAIVTRVQWQAAVDALKAAEQVWDGEGLPPAGTVCEFIHSGVDDWVECLVIGYHLGHLYGYTEHELWKHRDGCCHLLLNNTELAENSRVKFRPIRTTEQIAAEEREAGIRQIQVDHGVRARDGGRVIAEKLYDAGYCKQVQP